MYICHGCLDTAPVVAQIEHADNCIELNVTQLSFFLKKTIIRISELEQRVASMRTDLQQAADLLRKYSKP